MTIMQKLYDSEINCCIASFWDGGFRWVLGDDMNGVEAEGTADSYAEAEAELAAAARVAYPNSLFATGVKPTAAPSN